MGLEEKILEAAGKGPVKLEEIAAAVGANRAVVSYVLGTNGWVRSRGHGDNDRLWRLPTKEPAIHARNPSPSLPPAPPSPLRPKPPPPKTETPKSKLEARSIVRIIIPDSHGNHIDPIARDAFLSDLRSLGAHEVVFLGDHLDCGGTFSAHQRSYTNEMAESYEDDVSACADFLDQVQAAAPSAEYHYLEGNHEQHVERWAARNFTIKRDADKMLERYGPAAVLDLNGRGIHYYRRSEHYQGINIPGTIKLGKCFFTHGIAHSKQAASVHVERFGGNVVFGHIHRDQSFGTRTVTSEALRAWCPGTLAKLQPLYQHTSPSNWTHGYAVQFVASSGEFLHINVPIFKGKSMLVETVRAVSEAG